MNKYKELLCKYHYVAFAVFLLLFVVIPKIMVDFVTGSFLIGAFFLTFMVVNGSVIWLSLKIAKALGAKNLPF